MLPPPSLLLLPSRPPTDPQPPAEVWGLGFRGEGLGCGLSKGPRVERPATCSLVTALELTGLGQDHCKSCAGQRACDFFVPVKEPDERELPALVDRVEAHLTECIHQ